MAAVSKIDSNATGLSYAEELTLGNLPVTPIWVPLEPNSYNDFGGQLTLLARNPINSSRQRKKGVITNLAASGGFNNDLTQTNLQELLQGFMFADFRRKGEEAPTAIDLDTSNPDEFEVASTAGFLVGSLIKSAGWTASGNNGIFPVTAIVNNVSVEVATGTLASAETGGAGKTITVVGHRAAAGDITVTSTGNYATYASTTLDFTTLGLIPGEWIFVGGDSATTRFFNSVNNGFKRVRSIAAHALVVDKSTSAMVADDGTANGSGGTNNVTIEMYFGRVLKNEQDTLIKRRSYNLERKLGAPDAALPSQIQSEYLTGSIPNQFTVNIPTADKVNCDLSFVSLDHETRDGATGVKSGTRQALVESDAFNTSSDFSRIKLAVHSTSSEAPTSLFAFVTQINLTINNNLSPAKAVGVMGAFDVTAGTFTVGGNITAYFADVAAIAAVRANADVTLDMHLVKANAGISIDVPLIALGDGRANVQQDQPILLPLSTEAADGSKIDANLNHTLLMVFYDYLPSAADV